MQHPVLCRGVSNLWDTIPVMGPAGGDTRVETPAGVLCDDD